MSELNILEQCLLHYKGYVNIIYFYIVVILLRTWWGRYYYFINLLNEKTKMNDCGSWWNLELQMFKS